MNSVKFLIISAVVFSMNISCSSQTNTKEQNTKLVKAEKIEVLYFHYTRRCATCNAVESVSKEAVSELYGNKVSFADYNLDEEAGKIKGTELEISGQTLLIVADNTIIDITNEGFMNARSNPDKLKQIIKEKIDPLIN
ncbi:MAG: hypothetical protein JXJ22_11900 [Bacteroidales bacterium]|nr:hypothetical protein [Bacteroidales bacterium]